MGPAGQPLHPGVRAGTILSPSHRSVGLHRVEYSSPSDSLARQQTLRAWRLRPWRVLSPPEIGSAGALGLLDPRPSLRVARAPGNRIALPATFVATTAPRSSQLHPSFLARTLPAPVYKGDPPPLSRHLPCAVYSFAPRSATEGKRRRLCRRRFSADGGDAAALAPRLWFAVEKRRRGPGKTFVGRHRIGSVLLRRILHRSIALAADPPRVDARGRRFVILGTDLLLRFDGPSIRFSPGSDGDLGSGSSSGMVRPWPPPWGWVAPLRASVRLGKGCQP
jgi:hypothetical protein